MEVWEGFWKVEETRSSCHHLAADVVAGEGRGAGSGGEGRQEGGRQGRIVRGRGLAQGVRSMHPHTHLSRPAHSSHHNAWEAPGQPWQRVSQRKSDIRWTEPALAVRYCLPGRRCSGSVPRPHHCSSSAPALAPVVWRCTVPRSRRSDCRPPRPSTASRVRRRPSSAPTGRWGPPLPQTDRSSCTATA